MGAWNVRTSRQVTPDREIFKFPTNDQGFASIVLDATAVAADADGNRKLVAGTILTKNATTNQYERFTAAAGQPAPRGVLAHTVVFADGTSKSDQPAALAFHAEVFRADRIIDFGTHGAALRAALPTCRFD